MIGNEDSAHGGDVEIQKISSDHKGTIIGMQFMVTYLVDPLFEFLACSVYLHVKQYLLYINICLRDYR